MREKEIIIYYTEYNYMMFKNNYCSNFSLKFSI